MKMVNTRGKKNYVSPKKTSEVNEAAENSEAKDQTLHSPIVDTKGKNKTSRPNKASEANEVADNSDVMVNTGGKDKSDSPNKTSEVNEVAENGEVEGQASQSLTVNVEELNGDGQFEDKVEVPVEETGTKGCEEKPGGAESEKAPKVGNDDGDLKMAELEQNTSEDDDIDYQEDQMSEDDEESSEEDDEENIADEDGASGEDAIKEDDDVDEVGLEKGDDGKDEVSRDKTACVAKEDETKAKAKEDGVEAKVIKDGGEAMPKKDEEEAKTKEDGREAEAKSKENGKETKEHDNGKVEAGSKNDKNTNKKIRKKKLRVVNPKKVDSKDKPESSQKIKGQKRESMGMIFMCSSKTRADCFQYKVLGLPGRKKDVVEKIYSGMRLFLYDVDLKLMHGIFKAAGPGGYNIEPKAFKSQFPSQVRFVVLDDCLPLPEEKFKKAIKENYFTKNKFDCQLKAEQVKKLCKLFVTSSKKQHLPKKSNAPRQAQKSGNPKPVNPETNRKRRVGDKRHPAPNEREPSFRKRPRKAISGPQHQPLPAPVPSYAYERSSNVDAYNRQNQHSYRDGNELPPLIRRAPYLDPYRDVRGTYVRPHPDPYTDRGLYLEHREPGIGIRRASYLERGDQYKESAYSVTAYMRDPPLSNVRDAYREDQGVMVRPEYGLHPLTLETRYHPEAYASTRQLPLYGDRIYSAEYPSRVGLAREYRL